MPNTGNNAPGSWKELRIQVTMIASVTGPTTIESPLIDINPPGTLIDQWEYPFEFEFFPEEGIGMVVFVQDWRIEPNPTQEFISIDHLNYGVGISEVVIDTICIPEPATLCLFGLGGLVLTSVVRFRRTAAALE